MFVLDAQVQQEWVSVRRLCFGFDFSDASVAEAFINQIAFPFPINCFFFCPTLRGPNHLKNKIGTKWCHLKKFGAGPRKTVKEWWTENDAIKNTQRIVPLCPFKKLGTLCGVRSSPAMQPRMP